MLDRIDWAQELFEGAELIDRNGRRFRQMQRVALEITKVRF